MPLWERSGLQRLHHTGGVFLPQLVWRIGQTHCWPHGGCGRGEHTTVRLGPHLAIVVFHLGPHLAIVALPYAAPWSLWAASWDRLTLTTGRVPTSERTYVLFHDKLDVRADHLARLLLEPLFLWWPQNFHTKMLIDECDNNRHPLFPTISDWNASTFLADSSSKGGAFSTTSWPAFFDLFFTETGTGRTYSRL